ncbi:MAG: carbon-nitrogen family hydrolase [Anaerolineae bacterium]|nr:carbon-nitrogen family hydrolase [Anaerolineae bacterium]
MSTVRVAAIQMNIAAGDPAANRRRMADLARRALDGGSQLVLFPELAACGYDLPRLDALAEPLDGETAEAMSDLAARYRAHVAWGMAERDDDRFYNTLALAGPGGNLLARYRKAHLIPLLREPDYFTPGGDVVVVPTDIGRIGLAICYDLRFPSLFQRMAALGVEVLLVAAQWPQVRAEHWRILTAATALQSLAFLVGANGVGLCCGDPLAGRSVVASPWGERVAEAGTAEEILCADVDLADVAEARRKLPVAQGQRPELYL